MATAVGEAAFTPGKLGPPTRRNRFIKTAPCEGMSPGGIPSGTPTAHHRAIAAGGVATTAVAYCAVSPDGHTFRQQTHMRGGFEFIAIGRALIHDPGCVERPARGEVDRSACNPCNECVAEMDRGGVRCVLV